MRTTLSRLSQTTPTLLIGVAASDNLPAEQVNVFTDTAIFSQSGQVIATAQMLVNQILHSPKALVEFLRFAQDHHKVFNLHTTSVTEGPAKNPIYLLKADQDPPLLRLIESLTISGDAAVKTSPLPLKHGKLEDTTVAWGTTLFEGKQAMMVASEDKTGNTKASFDTGERVVQLQRPPATGGTSA